MLQDDPTIGLYLGPADDEYEISSSRAIPLNFSEEKLQQTKLPYHSKHVGLFSIMSINPYKKKLRF